MNDIVVVEGFDMVGKTHFMNTYSEFNNYSYYHPNYYTVDKVLGRDNAWTIGYGIFDMLSSLPASRLPSLLIDRGVLSSYVYGKMFNTELPEEVIMYYKDSNFYHELVDNIIVRHSSKKSASKLYDLSKSRIVDNDISSKYDTYSSFEDYYSNYLRSMDLFREACDLMNIKPLYYDNSIK